MRCQVRLSCRSATSSGVMDMQASQESCSGDIDEMHVGIVDASGSQRGVLHLTGLELRKSRYGALRYCESEINNLREFGKTIGAFLEGKSENGTKAKQQVSPR